jgi:hypothetical protein
VCRTTEVPEIGTIDEGYGFATRHGAKIRATE